MDDGGGDAARGGVVGAEDVDDGGDVGVVGAVEAAEGADVGGREY